MLKRIAVIVAVLLLPLFVSGCIFVGPAFGRRLERVTVEESPRWLEVNRIVLVDIDGFIGTGDAWSLLGGTTVADVKERLNRAAEDRSVAAVVLRINSPGGDASASDMIYQEVRRFKERTGKPVVAALLGVAASGGYYIACAADRVVAQPTCITGSVGVIMHFYNVEGLYYKLGLRREVIKSGAMKDIASMTRTMSAEERAVLEHLNATLYDRFLGAVKTGRPAMTEADLGQIADGRPVTADEALSLHMVDRVGYLSDALAEARDLADISGADVIMYSPMGKYNTNIYAGSPSPTGALERALESLARRQGPAFLYLWDPGH